MKKQELLDALQAKFAKVLTPKMERDEAGIKWYLVGVYVRIGDVMLRKNIAFYVENEGTDNETAYWCGAEPNPAPTTTFGGKVAKYIVDKITAKVIKEAGIERVDETNKTAVIRAVVDDAGTLIERRFLVNEAAGDVLQHTRIAEES